MPTQLCSLVAKAASMGRSMPFCALLRLLRRPLAFVLLAVLATSSFGSLRAYSHAHEDAGASHHHSEPCDARQAWLHVSEETFHANVPGNVTGESSLPSENRQEEPSEPIKQDHTHYVTCCSPHIFLSSSNVPPFGCSVLAGASPRSFDSASVAEGPCFAIDQPPKLAVSA